jgi:hypothetical protein
LCEQETNKKGGKKRILFSFQGRKGRPVNDGVIALIDWGEPFTFFFFSWPPIACVDGQITLATFLALFSQSTVSRRKRKV